MLDRILIGASSAETTDPNFKNVTLLLHGDGSNGAQNNTFLDSSTNNFTITRNGNTTQGSFSPYGSNWSNYFDGASTLTFSQINMAGDFTIESWVYYTGTGDGTVLGALPPNHQSLRRLSGKHHFYREGVSVSGTIDLPVNQWVHLAATRSGSTVRIFTNGVLDGSVTVTGTFSLNCLGGINTTTDRLTGYASNVRIVNGTALYTSTFTPSTTPLTAITNTSLLTCQSNRFRDASTNNFTITRNGDVKVTNFAPFAPSAAYSTTTNGGSAYSDGSGDYLTLASNTSLAMETSNFTWECWLYPFALGTLNTFWRNNAANGAQIGMDDTGQWGIAAANTAWIVRSSTVPTAGMWNHIAVSRSGSNLSLFLNGTRVATTASGGTNFAAGIASIFAESSGSYNFNAYMSDIRLVKGSAVYDPTSTTYTVPTSPLSAVTNTNLLIKGTNAAIFDNSMKNDLETGNSAQISTSVKKFGSGSMYFPNNGSCDFLVMSQSPIYAMPGDFTVEFWLYPTLVDANDHCIYDTRASGSDSGAVFFLADTGKIRIFAHGGIRYTSTTALSVNTWSHVAIVRQSGTISSYINGTKDATTSSFSSALTANAVVYVARRMDDANTNGVGTYRGYIDEMRVTPGLARYTASFTAPTAPFPNK